MTLRQKQSIFAKLVPRIIDYAYSMGYEITLGEALRSEEEAKRLKKLGVGVYPTLHMYKLAIDLNLFEDGKYLSSTLSHRLLGEFWESLSVEGKYTCCWGGRFKDGNHYSLEHNGLRWK